MARSGLWAAVLGVCLTGCVQFDSRYAGLDRERLRRAREAITLVRDCGDLLPLRGDASTFVLKVQFRPAPYAGRLRELLSLPVGAEGDVELGEQFDDSNRATLRRAASYERVILVLHTSSQSPFTLPGVVDLVKVHPAVVILAFGHDEGLLSHYDVGASTLIWAGSHDLNGEYEVAAADVLMGRWPVTGRLDREIYHGVAPAGTGQSRFGVLCRDRAPDIATELTRRIARLLESQVGERVFPGAVAMVTRRGQVLAEVAVGRLTYDAGAAPVHTHTRYDLASLTKVCATLPALTLLLEQGVIDLDDPLVKWVPEFAGTDKAAITLRQVAVHAAGLQWWVPFYQTLQGKVAIVHAAASHPLAFAPLDQYKYSDLGLILLMAVIERAGRQPFEQFLRSKVYPKLGVQAVFSRSGTPIAAAPTELDAWRGRTVTGEVHDENAFAMGGTSGHAGLFGTAEDVARIGNAFLGGGGGLWRPSTVRRLVRRVGLIPGSSRAILWDTFVAGGSGGSKLSERAFGHTGFTGTSVWCDPATDLCMVLLTNRVHPTRKNRKISAARRAFCDLVVDTLQGR